MADIGVAGCGIAGLACAAFLARVGHRVVIFEKAPAPVPLGSGLILQPVGLTALDAIGVGAELRGAGARIERLYGRETARGRVVLDVRYAASGARGDHGVGVHRGALFEALYKAARAAGADIEPGREISAHDGSGRLHFTDASTSAKFDLLIDALGVRSPLRTMSGGALAYGALWANVDMTPGFQANALEQRYQRARKMAGVLPIGAGKAAYFWSLKGEAHPAWRAASLDAWKQEARALWPETAPLLDQIAAHEHLVFARYAHATMRSPFAPGVVHVGDAAHCASPQLGQGANMALLDAWALARAIEVSSDLSQAGRLYARMRRWHVRLYQLASFLFTPAYQSDSALAAFIRDWLMSPISRIWPAPPLLAALVSGRLGAPLGAIQRQY